MTGQMIGGFLGLILAALLPLPPSVLLGGLITLACILAGGLVQIYAVER